MCAGLDGTVHVWTKESRLGSRVNPHREVILEICNPQLPKRESQMHGSGFHPGLDVWQGLDQC